MAETESLGHKALKGTIWASIDRFSTIGVQFIVNLVLARLLMPSDFGAIGMLTIFIGVSQVIIDGGFISALIQKKAPTQTDYSTIFYWNIVLALLLYAILFISSPYIAEFYRMPVLNSVLRALGIGSIIFSINVVQAARLRKMLAFKSLAIANLTAIVVSGIVGIVMARYGFGVWSLVTQTLIFNATTTILYFILTHWIPSAVFSIKSLRELFGFGGFLLLATIFQEVCRNFQGIIIGRRFSAAQMGFYSQAYRLDQVTSNALPQVISQVMFPIYSTIQDDLSRLRDMLANNIRIIAFCIFPLMGALIIAAEPIIVFLYGDKWIPAAHYFQILCVGGLFACLQNVNYFAVAAVGRSKDLFFWSIYKWGFLLGAMFVGMEWGMNGLMWSIAASAFNIYLVNASLVARHVGLSLWLQLSILLPILSSIVAAMVCALILARYCGISPIISSIVCILIYLFINFAFQTTALQASIEILKKLKHRHD